MRSLAASGTNVYAGTDAVNVAGIAAADHVARWSGSAWSAVGSNSGGTNGWFPATAFVYGLTTYGSMIVAVGSFQNANGIATADSVAYFDGSAWRPIGSNGAGNGPFIGTANATAVTGGKVYVGGNFTSAGGDSHASYLASYALRLPDAAVGAAAAGPFVGNNVYSSTAAGELRHVVVKRGKRSTSYVRVQNDGLVAASFTIRGTGGARGIHVRYFAGSTNLTSAVRAGTYSTVTIGARASLVLKVVVKVSRASAKHASFTTSVRSQSGTPSDAVLLTVRAKG